VLASRTHWRLLTATILVLIAAAWLVPSVVAPPKVQENRVLAKAPSWPHRLQDVRRFRKDADAYVADNFPARRHLIGVLNRLRMLFGVSGSDRVIVGRDGWLFYDDDTHLGSARNTPPMSGAEVRDWLMTMAGRTEAARAAGAHYLVVLPPLKETLYPQYAPAWFDGVSAARPGEQLPRLAKQAQAADVLYLRPPVAEATRMGERTFSRHDTHWTGYGAYAGYVSLMRHLQALGLAEGPRPLSDFKKVTEPARQGPRDLALMLGVASFVDLDYQRFDDPPTETKLRRTFLGPRRDWTAPQVLDTGEVGKPVLLMTRDSFSNELLPFMLSHFSRIVLTHNGEGFWRPDLIDRFKPDIVILEVVESGVRVANRGGPPTPSPEARARIDHLLGAAQSPSQPPLTTSLQPATPDVVARLAAAKPALNCNIEGAALTSVGKGEATLQVVGWISELAPHITSPQGYVRLQGPGVDLVASIAVDHDRSDVAAYFKIPSGLKSGFDATLFVRNLPAGAYAASVYRRSPEGWIGCHGKQPLIAP
jgi:hypothetical protein